MFGGYGLFRSGFNYALVAATAFLGETDLSNGILNTNGSYDTEGYAVTGSVGHIFMLTERCVSICAADCLASSSTATTMPTAKATVRRTKISFGAIKFEPGLYMDRQLDNGMVFSPYARAELQQRFGYDNTSGLGS